MHRCFPGAAALRSARTISLLALLGGALALAGCSKEEGSSKATGATSAAPDPAGPKPAQTAAAAEKKPASDEVTFKKKAPAVGDKRVSTSNLTMKLTMTLEGIGPSPKSISVGKVEAVEKNEEVLAVDKDIITKLKVTYNSKSDVDNKDGKEKTKSYPVVGKTYVLESKDGKLAVLTEKGTPAPAAEASIVQKDYKQFGKKDDFQSAVPERSLKVGEKVDELTTALKEKMFAGEDEKRKPEVQDAEIRLASVREVEGKKVGVFDVTLKVKMTEEPLGMLMDLKGQIEVGVDDAWARDMKLEGPITASIDKKPNDKMNLSGSGTMAMSMGSKYL